jgi:hypothetical protein
MVASGGILPKNASKEEAQEIQAARLANVQNNVSGLFASNTDKNQTGFDFFFGAGASMQSLKTVNSARLGIEGRARNLLSEIRMDQLRGRDTSMKREQLANLTESVSIMNKNLGNNVDRALQEPTQRAANTPSIIDRINADLKRMQEAASKSVQDKWGAREAPEAETPPAPEAPPSAEAPAAPEEE